MGYKKEEKLELKRKIWITEKEYQTLRKQKSRQKISMAKIVCNLIIDKYASDNGTAKNEDFSKR